MTKLSRFFESTSVGFITMDAKGKGVIGLERVPESKEEWQLRVSIYPSRENIKKAADALEALYQSRPDFPEFKLYIPKEGDLKAQDAWWGAYSALDRNQLGKECCVYIDKDNDGQTPFNKKEYVELMVAIWAALDEAKVELGYAAPAVDEKRVICDEAGVVSPFCYSAFKPWKDREHGIMTETSYNPCSYQDPLEGVVIPADMLRKARVSLYRYFLSDAKSSYDKQREKLDKAAADCKKDFEALVCEPLEKPLPKEKQARLLTVDWHRDNSLPSSADEAKQVIEKTRQEFLHLIRSSKSKKGEDLGISSEDLQKALDRNPHGVQKLYRRYFHIKRERQAISHHDVFCEHFNIEARIRKHDRGLSLVVLSMGYSAGVASASIAAGMLCSIMRLVAPQSISLSSVLASTPSFAIFVSVAAVSLMVAIVASVFYAKNTSPRQVSFLRKEEFKRGKVLQADSDAMRPQPTLAK